MKITVETVVNAPINQIWSAWSNPDDIIQWNTPHESWHTTRSAVDLREGGQFSARMEARDGSGGFEVRRRHAHREQHPINRVERHGDVFRPGEVTDDDLGTECA